MGRESRWSQNWTIVALAILTAAILGFWEVQSPTYTYLTIVSSCLVNTTCLDHDSVGILIGNTDASLVSNLGGCQPSQDTTRNCAPIKSSAAPHSPSAAA